MTTGIVMSAVCATCRVIAVKVSGMWVHPPQLREQFSKVVCDAPIPGAVPGSRELVYGRGDAPRSARFSLQDRVPRITVDAGAPVALATNGSYKVSREHGQFDGVSWGYVASNGAYGLGTAPMPSHFIADRPGARAELRAIWLGVRQLLPKHPVLVVSNSVRVVQSIEAWKRGKRPMPGGYDRSPRAFGRPATLVALADLIEANAGAVQTMWVQTSEGVALNEGAHALARIAQAWASRRIRRNAARGEAERVARRTLREHPC